MGSEIDKDKLHEKLLTTLQMFHQFCLEFGLKYYMIGGTALGAKRHHGFIPWDDDIDIGMLREDYDKLVRLSDCLPEGLELFFCGKDDGQPFPYVKIINSNTTLIEQHYVNFVEGIYIDVFPIDYMVNDGPFELLRFKFVRFIEGMLLLKYRTDQRKGVKKVIKRCLSMVKGKILFKMMTFLMTRDSACKGKKCVIFLGAYGLKDIYDKSIFGAPVLYQFENTSFYGPQNIDGYLSTLYGNYMRLPPEKERIFKHSFAYLDMDKPYRDYKEKIYREE